MILRRLNWIELSTHCKYVYAYSYKIFRKSMLKLMFWRNFEMMSYYSFLAIYLNELINHTCFCITASGTNVVLQSKHGKV
jgi:hypothetical protein